MTHRSDIPRSRRPIFLIGFMATGKTTLGKALAHATGREFIDLDSAVEHLAGKSVSRIFAENGEAHFRDLERQALQTVAFREDCIVACGGGTPCRKENMDLMNSSGLTVLLEAELPRLLDRLEAGRAARPLVAAISSRDELARKVNAMLTERNPHYRKALARFDSSRLDTASEISESVERFINQFNLITPQR